MVGIIGCSNTGKSVFEVLASITKFLQEPLPELNESEIEECLEELRRIFVQCNKTKPKLQPNYPDIYKLHPVNTKGYYQSRYIREKRFKRHHRTLPLEV